MCTEYGYIFDILFVRISNISIFPEVLLLLLHLFLTYVFFLNFLLNVLTPNSEQSVSLGQRLLGSCPPGLYICLKI